MTTLKEFGFYDLCESFSLQRAQRREMLRKEDYWKEIEENQQTHLNDYFWKL